MRILKVAMDTGLTVCSQGSPLAPQISSPSRCVQVSVPRLTEETPDCPSPWSQFPRQRETPGAQRASSSQTRMVGGCLSENRVDDTSCTPVLRVVLRI